MLNALLLAVNLGEVSGSFFATIVLVSFLLSVPAANQECATLGVVMLVATGDGQAAL